ncbi:MAG: hypothetical protein KDD58_12905 [Bdellovibrionales bacterium]|nr:hypothetical protein [Bdellovibrionales bacterium]
MEIFKISILIIGLTFGANAVFATVSDSSLKLLVWDFGDAPNELDSGDIIFDVSKPCNSDDLNLNFPTLKSLSTESLHQLSGIKPTIDESMVDDFLTTYPLEDDVKKMVTVMDSFKGKGDVLFILLPEAHNNLPAKICDQQCNEHHGLINATRTYFSVKLVKAALEKEVLVSNFREGVEGNQWQVDNIDLKGKSPKERFEALFEAGYHTPFRALGNTFEEQGVFTSYVETPLMIYSEIFSVYGEFKSGVSFEQAVAKVKSDFDPSIDEEQLRVAYEFLKTKSDLEIDAFAHKVCQDRSVGIASESLKLATAKKHKLVFLSFGASHFHGVSKVLKDNHVSYLAIVGKSKIE